MCVKGVFSISSSDRYARRRLASFLSDCDSFHRRLRLAESVLTPIDDEPFGKHDAPRERRQKHRCDENADGGQLDKQVARDVVTGS